MPNANVQTVGIGGALTAGFDASGVTIVGLATSAALAAETARATAAESQLAASRAPVQGLDFDGSASAATLMPAPGTGDFTISFNFRLTSIGGGFSSCFTGGLVNSIAFGIQGGLAIYLNGAGSPTLTGATTVQPNVVYVGTYVRSAGVGYLYLDGALDATGADANNYSVNVTQIGGQIGTLFVNGTIAYPRYLNRALSATEVAALFVTGQLSQADTYGGSMTALNSSLTADTGAPTDVTATTVTFSNTEAQRVKTPNFKFTTGQKIRVTGTVSGLSSVFSIYTNGGALHNVSANGSFSFVISDGVNFSNSIYIDNAALFPGSPAAGVISSLNVTAIGALLNPDAAQPGSGPQWRDVSGNGSDIILPGDGVSGGVSWSQPSLQPITLRVPLTTGYAWGVGNPCIPPGYVLTEAWAGATAAGTLSMGGSSSDTVSLIAAQLLVPSSKIVLAGNTNSANALYLSGTGLSGYLYLTFSPAQ